MRRRWNERATANSPWHFARSQHTSMVSTWPSPRDCGHPGDVLARNCNEHTDRRRRFIYPWAGLARWDAIHEAFNRLTVGREPCLPPTCFMNGPGYDLNYSSATSTPRCAPASEPPDTQAVGNTVDIVEPRRDEVDLQNRGIVEAESAENVNVSALYVHGPPRQRVDVVQHGSIGRAQLRRSIIDTEGRDKLLIPGCSTQKLCVRFRSIEAVVNNGNNRCDHLVLTPCQRQIRG